MPVIHKENGNVWLFLSTPLFMSSVFENVPK